MYLIVEIPHVSGFVAPFTVRFPARELPCQVEGLVWLQEQAVSPDKVTLQKTISALRYYVCRRWVANKVVQEIISALNAGTLQLLRSDAQWVFVNPQYRVVLEKLVPNAEIVVYCEKEGKEIGVVLTL